MPSPPRPMMPSLARCLMKESIVMELMAISMLDAAAVSFGGRRPCRSQPLNQLCPRRWGWLPCSACATGFHARPRRGDVRAKMHIRGGGVGLFLSVAVPLTMFPWLAMLFVRPLRLSTLGRRFSRVGGLSARATGIHARPLGDGVRARMHICGGSSMSLPFIAVSSMPLVFPLIAMLCAFIFGSSAGLAAVSPCCAMAIAALAIAPARN